MPEKPTEQINLKLTYAQLQTQRKIMLGLGTKSDAATAAAIYKIGLLRCSVDPTD